MSTISSFFSFRIRLINKVNQDFPNMCLNLGKGFPKNKEMQKNRNFLKKNQH